MVENAACYHQAYMVYALLSPQPRCPLIKELLMQIPSPDHFLTVLPRLITNTSYQLKKINQKGITVYFSLPPKTVSAFSPVHSLLTPVSHVEFSCKETVSARLDCLHTACLGQRLEAPKARFVYSH